MHCRAGSVDSRTLHNLNVIIQEVFDEQQDVALRSLR